MRRVLLLLLVGAIGGFLSGMFGVGGGIIMVPLLVWLVGLDQRHASATSLVAIVPSAVAGAIQYAVAGHLDILAGLLIAAGGIVGSLVGTRLLKTLPLGWLRWLFVGLLALTGSIANTRNGLVRPLDGIIAGLAATAASFGGVAVAFLLTPQLASILFAVLLVVAITQMVLRAIRDR